MFWVMLVFRLLFWVSLISLGVYAYNVGMERAVVDVRGVLGVLWGTDGSLSVGSISGTFLL